MAIVESPSLMSFLEEKLMARDRIRLPPLPPSLHPQPSLPTGIGPGDRTPLFKRRSPVEDLNPRPKKSLNFSSGPASDMETYHGHVRTPQDAIILFEACRVGLLPRVQRRLSEKERQSIKSGSVFVWDEREAGMRRWTDGKSWSASRVSGSFLTYREMEGKRGGGGNGYPPPVTALSRAGRTPDSTHGSESEIDVTSEEGPDGYRYKPDGLVKQSFSITTSSGNHLHLISYYSRAHPTSQQLNSPSNDPALRQIRPAKGMYPESTVQEHQNIPAVTRSPMAGGPYTTTPQMAGYARQGPQQWQQQQQQPYWNSSPSAQPSYGPYSYPYPPAPGSAHGPPPPYANGHPSGSYPQPPLHSPSQPPTDSRYPGYDSHPPPAHHEHPGYDSRRPPPLSPGHQNLPTHNPNSPGGHARPPPPPTTFPHPSAYSAHREGYSAGAVDPARAHESSRGNELAGRQDPPHPSQPNGGPSSSLHPQGFSTSILPLPKDHRSPPGPYAPSQPRHSPSTPIDPQLMSSSASASQRGGQPSDQHGSVPHVSGPSPSSASTIPSIGALVNGSTPQPQPASNPAGPSTPAQITNGMSSHPQSAENRSHPDGSQGREGPQDYAGAKVGFGEDSRTKGLLDKGFKV